MEKFWRTKEKKNKAELETQLRDGEKRGWSLGDGECRLCSAKAK